MAKRRIRIIKELQDFAIKLSMRDKVLKSSAEETIKEGIFSSRYAINPFNGDRIQIWITNYVLMDYGTGAVMVVPAQHQRDEFVKISYPAQNSDSKPDMSLKRKKCRSIYRAGDYGKF